MHLSSQNLDAVLTSGESHFQDVYPHGSLPAVVSANCNVSELEDDHPHDQCGVFGIWAPGEDVSRLTYFGLYALQHRGQQAAGIATSDGEGIRVYKDLGLVSQVFSEETLAMLHGHIAVGHCRYATTGADVWRNAQPMLCPTAHGTVALAHNGNLINTRELRELAQSVAASKDFERGSSTDTSVLTALIGLAEKLPGSMPCAEPESFIVSSDHSPAVSPHQTRTDAVASDSQLLTAANSSPKGNQSEGVSTQIQKKMSGSLVPAALKVLPLLRGAFSLVFSDENTLYAARDTHGYRPLALGKLDSGWVVASETAALDIVGARFFREVEPGELLAIDKDGVRSWQWGEKNQSICAFEYVYLARPDSIIGGRQVGAVRRAMGAALARENPVDADIVIPTPDSGIPAAIGYAEESGIPFVQGIYKNNYVGRTFIQPTQSLRQLGIRLKLNPMREVIEGKRLVVIDDSIVRGNTQRAIVRMLRDAGATEVHVRISSPPVKWPCYFGLDFPTREELIAANMDVEGVREAIGADSLAYLSLDALIESTGQGDGLYLGYFTGNYPEPIPAGATTFGGLEPVNHAVM